MLDSSSSKARDWRSRALLSGAPLTSPRFSAPINEIPFWVGILFSFLAAFFPNCFQLKRYAWSDAQNIHYIFNFPVSFMRLIFLTTENWLVLGPDSFFFFFFACLTCFGCPLDIQFILLLGRSGYVPVFPEVQKYSVSIQT